MTLVDTELAVRSWVDNRFLALDEQRVSYPLDAVFIPTLCRRENLTPLVAACSKVAQLVFLVVSDDIAANSFAVSGEAQVVVAPNNFGIPLWQLDATCNPSIKWNAQYDLPGKRNFALDLARTKGFKRIAFVDDDIVADDSLFKVPHSLIDADHGLVAFYSMTFPDVSTVDHLERIVTGQKSRVSPSGNCLIIRPDEVIGYFPYIYNEDWFFMLGAVHRGAKMLGAGFVRHLEHEPWLIPSRTGFEQFGDAAALGMSIGGHGLPQATELSFWEGVYNIYTDRLCRLLKFANDAASLAALEIAVRACEGFGAHDLLHYVTRCYSDPIGDVDV